MLESSGFQKYSTPVVFQLFYRRLCLCLCHCLCICISVCICNSWWRWWTIQIGWYMAIFVGGKGDNAFFARISNVYCEDFECLLRGFLMPWNCKCELGFASLTILTPVKMLNTLKYKYKQHLLTLGPPPCPSLPFLTERQPMNGFFLACRLL